MIKYIRRKIIPAKIRAMILLMRKLYTDKVWPIKRITYHNDGLITFHGSDFLKDPLFTESYKLGRATGSWGDYDCEWRAYVACWAAAKGKSLEGDFVECGVNRGGLSRMVMNYIDFNKLTDKKFYLLDTYCGFPNKHKKLASVHPSSYSECYEDVVKTFSKFKNAVIVRGPVPDTLPEVKAKKVCYLSLDMNCAEPEVAAAEFFWDKMTSGAVIVMDDYNMAPEYHRIKEAFNAFAEKKGMQILALPTGQGLIFKP